MTHPSLKLLTCALLGASAIGLVACGGGGGGGGGGAGGGGTPPTSNAAPSVVAVSDVSSQQEGQYFTLDSAGTRDADNDPLTFRWAQTAGPMVTISDATLAKLENLRVPEVAESGVATFELTVSDGKSTAAKTVNVAFANIHQMPRTGFQPPLVTQASLAGAVKAGFYGRNFDDLFFLALADPETGNLTISKPGLTPMNAFGTALAGAVSDSFEQSAVFGFRVQLAIDHTLSNFLVAEESRNKISAFIKPDVTAPFARRGEIAVSSPCSLHTDGGFYFYAGSRHGGLGMFEPNLVDDTEASHFDLIQPLGTSESFCALSTLEYPVDADSFTTPTDTLPPLLALDVDTNKVHFFDENGLSGAGAAYYDREVANLELEASEELTFVKAASTSRGLALLFTDGQHNGVHRLVFVGLDADRNIVQETYQWSIGVPSDIAETYLGNASRDKLIITSETSPDAIVFQYQDYIGGVILPLTGPSYLDVGLGNTFGQEMYIDDANGVPRYYFLTSKQSNHEAGVYGPIIP